VGTWDLDPLLDTGPLAARPEVVRFTSLFGGNCAGLLPGLDRIGTTEPCETVNEGESGPTLDLGLLLCEFGIVDSRLIHEPLEEIDSLRVSSSEVPKVSSCLNTDNFRPLLLFCNSDLVFEGR